MKTAMRRGRVLILLAHPDIKSSSANAALVGAVADIPNVEIVNLYETVWNDALFKAMIARADALVFQFPFYWAAAPSELKRWCDECFIRWSQSEAVAGKPLLVVTTLGSKEEEYRSGGRNRFTVDELLRPYQLLADHSGMIWQTPLCVYGTSGEHAARSIECGARAYRNLIAAMTGYELEPKEEVAVW